MGQAVVSWLAPASNGGSSITSYTVTSSPGGIQASVGGNTLAATVTGLTNGTSYTFTVTATNSAGTGPASSQSNAVTTGVTIRTYYYANGVRIATAVNGAFSYLATDGLGSADVTLDANGNLTAATLYAPYGAARYAIGVASNDYGFTGQHLDTSTGLDYFGARYYDPVAGQFTSPDTIVPGGGYDLWGLSRYAYVEGNPIINTDPTGRVLVCECGDDGGNTGNPQPPPPPASQSAALPPGSSHSSSQPTGPNASQGDQLTIPTYSPRDPRYWQAISLAKQVPNTVQGDMPSWDFNDPVKKPGPDWEWRGAAGSQPGDEDGAWFNPKTRESVTGDLNHGLPKGPHWDYWKQGIPGKGTLRPNGQITWNTAVGHQPDFGQLGLDVVIGVVVAIGALGLGAREGPHPVYT
jgi:RHS repeat-associated protein